MSKTVTLLEVVDAMMDRVEEAPGSDFFTLEFITTPKLNKTVKADSGKERNPHLGRISKVTRLTVNVNFSWDNAKKKELEAAGVDTSDPAFEFVSTRESWHVPMKDSKGRLTPFSVHKDDPSRIYFRVRWLGIHAPETVRQQNGVDVIESKSYYLLDGKTVIEKEDIMGMPQKSKSTIKWKDSQGSHEKDREVIFTTYNVSGLLHAAFGGENYSIIRD